MRHTPGVSGRVFSKLGNDGVNVLAIAQGSSEVSISLVVEADDTENGGSKALHELIVAVSAFCTLERCKNIQTFKHSDFQTQEFHVPISNPP